MKREVQIRVESYRKEPTGEEDRLAFTTSGWLLVKPWGIQLLYREQSQGLEGAVTVIDVCEAKLSIERRDSYSLKQTFEEGVWHRGSYDTPYGSLPLNLYACKVEIDLTGEGGNINVEYELEIGEACASLHRLSLAVTCQGQSKHLT